ncbi:hypothetical protein BDF14DRAFT_1883633 [Spinellus fusiger]|nr:hypothetical protein BDF14DRAFT_1883633 [Spinellus fusiger]
MEDLITSRSWQAPPTPSSVSSTSPYSPLHPTSLSQFSHRPTADTSPSTCILSDPLRTSSSTSLNNYSFSSSPTLYTSLLTSSLTPPTPPQLPLSDVQPPKTRLHPMNGHPIGKEIDKIIYYCDRLSETMSSRRDHFRNSPDTTVNSTITQPVLDDMIGRANEVLNALLRLRKHQIVEEQVQSQTQPLPKKDAYIPKRPLNTAADRYNGVDGILSGPQQRRRGKRAVFRGHCQSCNISETPEWRRGPNGARTLCNACGLHYAKSTRKQGSST